MISVSTLSLFLLIIIVSVKMETYSKYRLQHARYSFPRKVANDSKLTLKRVPVPKVASNAVTRFPIAALITNDSKVEHSYVSVTPDTRNNDTLIKTHVFISAKGSKEDEFQQAHGQKQSLEKTDRSFNEVEYEKTTLNESGNEKVLETSVLQNKKHASSKTDPTRKTRVVTGFASNVNASQEECVVELSRKSINHFRHKVYYNEISYAFLKLVPANSNISITGSKLILGESVWIWTFYGKEGSHEFLKWPEEFGIWSVGLLYTNTIWEPMNITLEYVSGDCSDLEVGKKDNDKIISKALKNLTTEMMRFDEEKYGPSFYCYKRRMYVDDYNIYMLCKHIVCPIEAAMHSCCSYSFNKNILERVVYCKEYQYYYDMLWWSIPSIIAIVLLTYSPILLTYLAFKLSRKNTGLLKRDLEFSSPIANSSFNSGLLEDTQSKERILFSGYQYITLKETLLLPIKYLFNCCSDGDSHCFSDCIFRCARVLVPLLSLSFIALQTVLDYYFLHNYVMECIKKGVPMGFRSILGGYKLSKLNFLPMLEGPFVALGLYLFVSTILLCIPKSPIILVTKVFREVRLEGDTKSPILFNIQRIGKLGSVRIIRRKGYSLIYHLLQAQFFMLLNLRYWKESVRIQYQRWNKLNVHPLFYILLPLYMVVCFLELVLCATFYAFPSISCVCYVLAGYTTNCKIRGRSIKNKVCRVVLRLILFCCVLYSLLMFCLIFLDAILFVTRVFIFTFTGIIVYPKVAYGYLIFGFTMFYYLWDSISEYGAFYQQLLKDTVHAANKVQRSNDSERIVYKINGESGIRQTLFEFVVEVHQPRRKRLFLSFVKAAIVLTVLWMLIHLLLTTDNFRELHVIMHVGTALFICALPQITKTVCNQKPNRQGNRKHHKELAETIKVYMGYFEDEF